MDGEGWGAHRLAAQHRGAVHRHRLIERTLPDNRRRLLRPSWRRKREAAQSGNLNSTGKYIFEKLKLEKDFFLISIFNEEWRPLLFCKHNNCFLYCLAYKNPSSHNMFKVLVVWFWKLKACVWGRRNIVVIVSTIWVKQGLAQATKKPCCLAHEIPEIVGPWLLCLCCFMLNIKETVSKLKCITELWLKQERPRRMKYNREVPGSFLHSDLCCMASATE